MSQQFRNGGVVFAFRQGQPGVDGSVQADPAFADGLADQGGCHGFCQGTDFISVHFFGKHLPVFAIDGKGSLTVPDNPDGDPCVRFAPGRVVQRILKGQTGDFAQLNLPVDHQSAENQCRAQHDTYYNQHNLFLPAFSCFFHASFCVFFLRDVSLKRSKGTCNYRYPYARKGQLRISRYSAAFVPG